MVGELTNIFSELSTVESFLTLVFLTFGPRSLFAVRGWSVHGRVFISVASLYPLNSSSKYSLPGDTENVSVHQQSVLGAPFSQQKALTAHIDTNWFDQLMQ